MKINKDTLIIFTVLLVTAALYRLIPFRPAGFAPQMALAIFGGALIKDKKWALTFPILSLFISDLMFQGLFLAGLVDIKGIYSGQWQLYVCFLLITVFGFFMKKVTFKNALIFSGAGSIIFFIISNFAVWLGGGGFARPRTLEGLKFTYFDALIFYRDGGLIKGFPGNFLIHDLIWGALLFGAYFLYKKYRSSTEVAVN